MLQHFPGQLQILWKRTQRGWACGVGSVYAPMGRLFSWETEPTSAVAWRATVAGQASAIGMIRETGVGAGSPAAKQTARVRCGCIYQTARAALNWCGRYCPRLVPLWAVPLDMCTGQKACVSLILLWRGRCASRCMLSPASRSQGYSTVDACSSWRNLYHAPAMPPSPSP